MYNLSDYYYELPENLIAQHPEKNRDHSKLLRLDRKNGKIEHRFFYDIEELLKPEDILVINNTRVIPARLIGSKETGGRAEVFLLEYSENSIHKEPLRDVLIKCLIKASKPPRPGSMINFDQGLNATVEGAENGFYHVRFSFEGNFDDILHRVGRMPVPPYIRRKQKSGDISDDQTSYQTVYATHKGAVAAPTAGLHFTRPLLDNIRKKGIKIVAITLHVGYGTFVPVRVSDIRHHRIHSERFVISEKTAQTINDGIRQKHRIIAVGTTCVRTLEYSLNKEGLILPGAGTCDLYIYPGYRFKVVDAMITNFHLPESTLIMLVSAFAGREKIISAYKNAIKNNYRFYSYGDAMLIE